MRLGRIRPDGKFQFTWLFIALTFIPYTLLLIGLIVLVSRATA